MRQLTEKEKLKPIHEKTISPHVIRHTTAMHLLQAGIDITTIAAWLGHSQISTTHGYIEIDLRMKQEAVALSADIPALNQAVFPQEKLLSWLEKLGRKSRYAQKPPPILASFGR